MSASKMTKYGENLQHNYDDAFILIRLEYNSTIVFQIPFESVLTVTLVPAN